MRIAMFGHKHIFTTDGGIEVVLSELVPLLAEMENEVSVYDRWELDLPQRPTNNRENVIIKKAPTFSKSAINAQMASFTATIRCLFHKYDVVHIHAEGPCTFIPLLKLFGKKVVVTIHGLDWQRDKWGKFARWYIHLGEKMAAKYADEVIVLSKDVQEYFKNTYGRSTTMIRNGVSVNLDYNTDEIEKFGLEKGNYILYLGRFAPEKNLHLLYNAYKMSGVKKKLVYTGSFAELEKAKPEDTSPLLQWYRIAKTDPDVVFTGHAEGKLKDQLFSNCAAFVLPSNLEGMSIALLESLGYGCRVIASDIPENVDILNGFGMTFRSGDVDSLMIRLQAVDQLPYAPNQDQIRFIKENYDWKKVAEETLEVYRRVA